MCRMCNVETSEWEQSGTAILSIGDLRIIYTVTVLSTHIHTGQVKCDRREESHSSTVESDSVECNIIIPIKGIDLSRSVTG